MLVASDYLFNKKWSGHGWINRTSSYGPDILMLGLCYIVISISLNPLKLESGFFQENMMVGRCQTIDSIHLEWIGNILNNLYYITNNPQYGCVCAN